jgi:hypothetical protein
MAALRIPVRVHYRQSNAYTQREFGFSKIKEGRSACSEQNVKPIARDLLTAPLQFNLDCTQKFQQLLSGHY